MPEQQQQSSLTSRLPPVKPVEAGLPSASVSSLMKMTMQRRAYKMPSSMKLPYDTSTNGDVSALKTFTSEASLASLLASRRTNLHSLKRALSTELPFPSLTRRISFCPVEDGHDAGSSHELAAAACQQTMSQHSQETSEGPPAKKRRFQRRNSKTPAMLMATAASIVSRDSDFTEVTSGSFF
ncbi:MAG: hypothetical protein SGILL_003827 [Bacillariaceae sp.]